MLKRNRSPLLSYSYALSFEIGHALALPPAPAEFKGALPPAPAEFKGALPPAPAEFKGPLPPAPAEFKGAYANKSKGESLAPSV
jgi:hypothetical protein